MDTYTILSCQSTSKRGIKVSLENVYFPREKDSNLLKGRCLWTVKSPNGVHLKLRDLAMSFVKFEVWDGKTIFLWHDNIVYVSTGRVCARPGTDPKFLGG